MNICTLFISLTGNQNWILLFLLQVMIFVLHTQKSYIYDTDRLISDLNELSYQNLSKSADDEKILNSLFEVNPRKDGKLILILNDGVRVDMVKGLEDTYSGFLFNYKFGKYESFFDGQQ